MNASKVLITGPQGFVGKHLIATMGQAKVPVHATTRAPSKETHDSNLIRFFSCGTIGKDLDVAAFNQALDGVETVIHLANRAHKMEDARQSDQKAVERLYFEENALGTESLARLAFSSGTKHFIFVSSIKVNGEESAEGFIESSTPCPSDPYGRSKLDAENRLLQMERPTGTCISVLRPSLIYGFGAKGNLRALVKALRLGFPLPLAGIQNQRSLLNVQTLCNLLLALTLKPVETLPKNQLYLVADSKPVSTPELLLTLGEALQIRPRLFKLPLGVLKGLAQVVKKGPELDRLTSSLLVDSSKMQRDFGFIDQPGLLEGLKDLVKSC